MDFISIKKAGKIKQEEKKKEKYIYMSNNKPTHKK